MIVCITIEDMHHYIPFYRLNHPLPIWILCWNTSPRIRQSGTTVNGVKFDYFKVRMFNIHRHFVNIGKHFSVVPVVNNSIELDTTLDNAPQSNESIKLLNKETSGEDKSLDDVRESRINPRFVGFELVDSEGLQPHWRHIQKSKRTQ